MCQQQLIMLFNHVKTTFLKGGQFAPAKGWSLCSGEGGLFDRNWGGLFTPDLGGQFDHIFQLDKVNKETKTKRK